MISLLQFNGSIVTPTDDAVLYNHMLGDSGIIEGVTVTSQGGNVLSVTDGRGVILGRQFVVEAQTVTASLPTSGTANGRLLIQIDMSDTTEPISFITQAAATLPDLVQEDINGSGTVYQFPLATYTCSTTAVSDLTYVAHSLGNGVKSFNGRTGDVTPKSGDYKATLVTMSGYSKATSRAAINTSDTVNSALGKLEYKVDNAAVGASVTLDASGWTADTSDYYCTKTVSGVTATNKVIVSPNNVAATITVWGKCGIYAAAQAANSITFRATKQPTESVVANILIIN